MRARGIPLRCCLSCVGLLFVSLTGIVCVAVVWTSAHRTLDPVAQKLRSEVLEKLVQGVVGTTDAVQQLAASGADIVGESLIGCCSSQDDDAKYLGKFSEVRRYLRHCIEHNQNLQNAWVATLAGSLVVLFRNKSSLADLDGTRARGGRGNLEWTLADATTQYRWYQWSSNAWHSSEEVVQEAASFCGDGRQAGYPPSRPLTSRGQCNRAAVSTICGSIAEAADDDMPKCCFTKNVTAWWSPTGVENRTIDGRALCQPESWFKRNVIFRPNCTHRFPCVNGHFEKYVEEGFDPSRFVRQTSAYNATFRAWWKGAVSNGNLSGAFCEQLAARTGRPRQCRQQPAWGPVFLSISAKELTLPSVFPYYVGSTDTVRAVQALGVSLKFLDKFLQDRIVGVSASAQAWIIDLTPGPQTLGFLLASSPPGLSTFLDKQSANVTGELKGVKATEALVAGSHGAHVQAASTFLLEQYGDFRRMPDRTLQTFEEKHLVQTQRLRDDYGLDWLVVLSVPEEDFLGDLPQALRNVIALVCGLSFGMALALFATTCIATRNLAVLGTKMAEVAEMRLDKVGQKRISFFSEVFNMEQSFRSMAQKLDTFWQDEQKRINSLEEEDARRVQGTVMDAIYKTVELGHPMVLVNAQTFVNNGRLVSYEVLRDRGKLTVLDTLAKIAAFASVHLMIFFSHQWLAWNDPDPDGVHFRAMARAVARLQQMLPNPTGSDMAALSDIYVWVDYSSIAQEHRGMQLMAVQSLHTYSSVCHAFVVIAPPSHHHSTGLPCDLESYDSRGWCRAETVSKVLGSGWDNIYIIDSSEGDLKEAGADELMSCLSLHPFQGEFSCCKLGHQGAHQCDMEHLVRPMLGLYAKLLVKSNAGPILEMIDKRKETFFPSRFDFALPTGGSESRELFGRLVKATEDYVAARGMDTGSQTVGIMSQADFRRLSQNDLWTTYST